MTSSHRWRRYPAHKPSGVEWLGEVPEGWKVRKLKYISTIRLGTVDKKSEDGEIPVRLCNYVDVYYNDYIVPDLAFMEATASSDEIKHFTLRKGDVLITKDSEEWMDIAVSAYVKSDLPGILCGYHLAHIRPDKKMMDGEYLFRSFQACGINDQFRVAANGITRFGIGKFWIDSSLFLVPPKSEQSSIAAFLDHETARIDTLIEKKERQIEILQEKRAALISHAVTKGLDPSVKMKDSGIEWLGLVPEEWEIKQLKLLARIQTGVAKGKDLKERTVIEVPYLRVANVQDGFLDLTDISTIEIEPHELGRYSLKIGDILMNEGGDNDKLGRGAIWDGQIVPCIHQNHVFSVRPFDISNSSWIDLITLSSYAKFYFTMKAKKTTNLASISSTNIGELPIIYPPKKQRDMILAYVKNYEDLSSLLIKKILSSIERLVEYRSALISAAVTGKIDVRQEAKV